jgi:tRNA nucleotidyltransferase/poly(A) polymerase
MPKEKELFQLLRVFVIEKCPGTVLRVAGGWVRDNFLKILSNDIDIAINNMSGEAFAKKLVSYMKDKGITTKGYTVVKANPEQSKHLATAMVDVLGFSIDFANLRKETYAKSRIPTIEPGTPEEDARRRDLTINALFYNIHTGLVEDYVGGLADIDNKIARTPINSVQTFMDDPLRILRIIRFAAKYDLSICTEIYDAALQPSVQSTILEKVSPERIWKEMAGQDDGHGGWKEGFFSGSSPEKAYTILHQMDLCRLFEFDENARLFFVNKLEDKEVWKTDPKERLVRTLVMLYWNYPKFFNHFAIKYGLPSEITRRVQKVMNNVLVDTLSDNELRKKIVKLGNDWRIAFQVSEALRAISSDLKRRINFQIELMGGMYVKLPINGNEIIAEGVTPGKPVGLVINYLTEHWYNNPQMTKKEAIDLVHQWLKENL